MPTPQDTSNEKTVIKNKFDSILSSMQVIDEERENMKELFKDLKESHSINPKVAKKVAKYMHDPEAMADAEETGKLVEALYDRIAR